MLKHTLLQRYLGRFLLAGESLSAGAGLAFSCTLVLTLSAAAFLWLRDVRDTTSVTEQRELRAMGLVVSRGAESMLSTGDLSALRRLLIELRECRELRMARIVLPDGRVIADAEPSKINLPVLPDQWAMRPIDGPDVPESDDLTVRFPLSVAGRGPAMLELNLGDSKYPSLRAAVLGSLALIAAAGLLVNLLLYRFSRKRLVSLSLIRESLRSLARGEPTDAGSPIDPTLGDEATAWNVLVAQTTRNRQTATFEKAKEVLGERRESKLDLESAVDGLSVGMLVVNADGRISHANGAAAALLRQKRDAIVGTEIAALIPDKEVSTAIAAVVGGSITRRVSELRLPGAAGESVLRVTIRTLRREDSGAVLVTLDDVTQQQAADAARNSFVSQATHELRTPLTNMRMCIEEAMEKSDSTPAELAVQLNMLNQESRRLERIIGDMLTVSEIEAGSLQLRQNDVKLDRLFQDLIANFEGQARAKGTTLDLNLPPKFPIFVADRDKLMLALHNLVGNAIKYTPAGGSVSVDVTCAAKFICISVRDSGIGISAEDQKKLFSRFYRASDPRVAEITGSGLGLALAREIAHLHGGDITVESEIDRGSTFSLTLPITSLAQAA